MCIHIWGNLGIRDRFKINVIFCYLLHIHSRKTGNWFSLFLCSLWWVQIVGCALAWMSYSYICTLHHLIIIIVQTYLKTLNLRLSDIFCFQFTNSLVMIERIYTLSYYHHQIGNMNYYLLFRVRSWSNGLRCMSFFILTILQQGWLIDLSQLCIFFNFLLCVLPSMKWRICYTINHA